MSQFWKCNACGVVSERALNPVGIKVHITEPNKGGYVDNQMVPVSGREVEVDLCNSCYNEAFHELYSKILEIQKKKTQGNDAD